MTNPVNIVPKNDNDGSRLGRESRRWTEASVIDITTQVIHLVSKAIDPTSTTNSLYVKDGVLYFSGTALDGVSEESIQSMVNAAVAGLDFITEAQAISIATGIAQSIVADAIDALVIPSTLADVGVDVSGVQDSYVLTYQDGGYSMQPPPSVVASILTTSDGTTERTVGLADEDVLAIVGSQNVNIVSEYSANGVQFNLSLPAQLTNVKASSSTTADRLSSNKTITLQGAVSGSATTNLSSNFSINASIPAGKLQSVLSAKIGPLLYKTKPNASTSSLPAISFVLAAEANLIDEPLVVFKPGACTVIGVHLNAQNSGIPEISSNGALRKITKDYEFAVKRGTVESDGSTSWTTISTSGGFVRLSSVTTDTYPGPFEDVNGVVVIDPALSSISSSQLVGLFYTIKTTSYSGYSVVSPLAAVCYGLSVNLITQNIQIN